MLESYYLLKILLCTEYYRLKNSVFTLTYDSSLTSQKENKCS